MSEPAANAPAPTTTTPATSADNLSVEQRADIIFSTGEPPAGNDNVGEAANTTAAPAPSESDAARAKRVAENRAQLAAWKAKERQRVDAGALQRENEQLKARLAEGSKPDPRIDPAALNEEKFFELAEQIKVPPQKLFEWLKANTERPELATIRKEVDPKLSAIEQENKTLRERLEALEGRVTSSTHEAEEREATGALVQFARQNASTAPLAVQFLEASLANEGDRGHEFYQLALEAAKRVPPNAGPQALLDEIEDELSAKRKALATYLGFGPNTQRPQATPRPNPAAAQAPTHVTNALASQRSSVVDEAAALENMSLEERAAFLFQS